MAGAPDGKTWSVGPTRSFYFTPCHEAARDRRSRVHRLDRRPPVARRRPRRNRARQPRAGAPGGGSGGARLVVADLLDREAVDAAMSAGFDGVMHFAALALVSESVSHPERYYRTNVGGTLNLLEAMVAAGVPRLVFSSTCAVYGQPDEVPIAETAVPRPVNAYGASKLAVDLMIRDFCPPRAGRGQPPVLQRRRRQRRARRGPRPRDAPHTQHPAGRARTHPPRRSTGPTTRRPTAPRSATTSTSRTSPPPTCSRSTAPAPASTGSSTSATATASRSAR